VLQWEPFLDELVQVIAHCSDPELLKNFLKSLLTPQEVEEVSTRWALVRFIEAGMSQRRIARTLGLSLCKITRGSRQLKEESSAFRKMIERYKRLNPASILPPDPEPSAKSAKPATTVVPPTVSPRSGGKVPVHGR
jgi:TrpR family trp operon transcriptional repressor